VVILSASLPVGLSTSKICTYVPPDPKPIISWPLSRHLGKEAG
jgi:hypothetical protein